MKLRLISIGFFLLGVVMFGWNIGGAMFPLILIVISIVLWMIARSISKNRLAQEEAENAIREDARQQAAIDKVYQDEYKKHM